MTCQEIFSDRLIFRRIDKSKEEEKVRKTVNRWILTSSFKREQSDFPLASPIDVDKTKESFNLEWSYVILTLETRQ